MQRTTTAQNAAPFFNTNIWGSRSNANLAITTALTNKGDHGAGENASESNRGKEGSGSGRKSRPGTSSGDRDGDRAEVDGRRRPSIVTKDIGDQRKLSFGRRASFSSPIKGKRRSSSNAGSASGSDQIITDAKIPPALPDFALAAAAKLVRDSEIAVQTPTSADSFSTMLGRVPTTTTQSGAATPMLSQVPTGSAAVPETSVIYAHIQELVNKRIATLDYLRKAHEGRVFWFNTLLHEKNDMVRMAYFDAKKLGRRATNYLLLGLSLPAVIDLNSSTPLEFLRCLNTLLTEFDSFQQIHTENGINASSLSRARLPQMFRRPGGKGRRTSSAAGGEIGYSGDGTGGGAGVTLASNSVVNQPTSVINFGLGSEGSDLLPGEEYTHLLTPSLPFDPDYFETFSTLCDVLIDCYTRLMNLIPTPRDCTPLVVELFTKADARVRKILIQGAIKEFEDSSRNGVKQEVTNVGKVVLGGLV